MRLRRVGESRGKSVIDLEEKRVCFCPRHEAIQQGGKTKKGGTGSGAAFEAWRIEDLPEVYIQGVPF